MAHYRAAHTPERNIGSRPGVFPNLALQPRLACCEHIRDMLWQIDRTIEAPRTIEPS